MGQYEGRPCASPFFMKLTVILHNIRSVHNVGSIFRTADAVGVEKIYLCGITPSPLDRFGKLRPDFAKVALGAEKYISWESAKGTVVIIKKLKKENYQIFALEQAKDSVSIFHLPRPSPPAPCSCLILGDEVRGIPPSVLKLADHILEIPMRGAMVAGKDHPRHTRKGKESLNVSVAFGIAAFALKSRK
jgi:23S rRNA (guanosine2251-2'-O)-methyltransferase